MDIGEQVQDDLVEVIFKEPALVDCFSANRFDFRRMLELISDIWQLKLATQQFVPEIHRCHSKFHRVDIVKSNEPGRRVGFDNVNEMDFEWTRWITD